MDRSRRRTVIAAKPRVAFAALSALLLSMSFQADACRTFPSREDPPIAMLASRSTLVAVVQIERFLPLIAGEEALLEHEPEALMNTPSTAEFSTVRVLKGMLPVRSLIRSSLHNCGVTFEEGKRYLVFSGSTSGTEQIVPTYGTFMLDDSAGSRAAMAQVESSLRLSNTDQP